MALTEKTVVDKIEILEDGQTQVREATIIERDGVEVSRTFHRKVLAPGDDTVNEDARVKAVTAATWTADVVSSYKLAPVEE